MSDLNGILEPNCMNAREQQLRDDYQWVFMIQLCKRNMPEKW